jgi:hypothetical protein
VRNTIIIIGTLIVARAWFGCTGSEDGTDTPAGEADETVVDTSEETTVTVTNTSEEAPPGEEASEPLSEYTIQEMEHLRSIGYPVYDKNVTICTGVTESFGSEYIFLKTADEKEEVVDFYVAAGGTPEYENGATVFRDWEMPIAVSASREGGTGVIYDVLGDVFSDETE